MKEAVAKEIARRVKNGEVIGVGTGTTVDIAIAEIAARIKKEGLVASFVPTSYQSAWGMEAHGITVLSSAYQGRIDWGFDGADAVNEKRWAIKGKGGALLQEKILAVKCERYFLIVDESKLCSDLAKGCAVPIEVIPEAAAVVQSELRRLKLGEPILRSGSGKHGPVITERGNILIDIMLAEINLEVESKIKNIVGVVESGLFLNLADEVLVGSAKGVRVI